MFRKTTLLWPALTRPTKHAMPSRQAIFHYKSSFSAKKLFSTTIESVPKPLNWTAYRELVDNDSQVSSKDLEGLSKHTLLNKQIKPSTAIARIQDILKYMSTRKDNPDVKASFHACCNYLIRAYVQQGDMKTARIVFDKMAAAKDVDVDSIVEILSGLRTLGTRAEIYEFQKSMEKKGLWTNDGILYTSIIYALSDFGDMPGCRHYFAEMKRKGLANTVYAYRAMISASKKANQPQQVLKYFREMQEEGIEPTAREYGQLFQSLGKDNAYSQLLKDIFEEIKAKNIEVNVGLYLSMGWDPLKALQEMKTLDNKITVRDCNSGLAYYIRNNQFSDALNVIKYMNESQIKMDAYSYSIMIDALAKDNNTPSHVVFDLYDDMKRNNLIPDQVLYTSLITSCCKNQDLDKALLLVREMQTYEVKPNIYTFNSILNVLSSMANTSSVDVERASLIWSQMTDLGIQPDTRTFNIYLSLISRLIKPVQPRKFEPEERYTQTALWDELEDTTHDVPQTVKEMQRMYRYMRRHKIENMQPDFVTYSIVINAMSTAGEIRSAMQVYDDAKMSRVTLPVQVYNEVMSALQTCGRVSDSMSVWHDMKLQSILPDNTTYNIVLENCEQLGLVDSIDTIRKQRKLDFNRLEELDKNRQARILKRYLKRESNK